jgi:hypothetical protein
MTMRFLDGSAAQARIADLVVQSSSIKMAVAFWGQPAPKILGLLTTQNAVQIVCNLKMGGTNPEAIEALQDAGISVLQSDHLHGKVYLFDTEAILGSSNASANGLSLQSNEIRGWHEANVSITEQPTLADISDWFDKLPKRKIEPPDLIAAMDAWSRRRRAGLDKLPPTKSTLIEDLGKDSGLFKGRRIFVCVYSEGLSPAGEKSLALAKKEAGREISDTIEGFEWPQLPDFADLLCFWMEKGRFYHDGLVHMPETRHEITKYGTTFQVCRSTNAIAGYPKSRIGTVSAWTPSLRALMQDGGDAGGKFLDMGEFAEKYLRA